MTQKEKAMAALEWHDFSRYPKQHSDIVIRLEGFHKVERKIVSKFIRVKNFNAVTFAPNKVFSKWGNEIDWWGNSWLQYSEVSKATAGL